MTITNRKTKNLKRFCNLCSGELDLLFIHLVLGKHNVSYYKCEKCGLIQTEEPYWLKESYSAPIIKEDTGLLSRNILLSKLTFTIIFFMFDIRRRFLDYAGGYGVFTRLMRDFGLDFYWDDKYTKNLFSKGYERKKGSKYAIVTAFEFFEHVEKPFSELQNIFSKYGCESLIFSTTLYPPDVGTNWWYFIFYSGQHISFYNLKTLKYIADRKKLYLYTNRRNIHMLSKKPKSNILFNILIILSFFVTPILRVFSRSKTIADRRSFS